jgi:peptidoglycan/xylan/chitin deacetylase (PgdA/CDA1 family)
VLFGGAQYRMEVGAAIAAGDGVVCIEDLAAELGDPPGVGSVNTELKVLERAGLLVRTAPEKGERRVFLLRPESVYWQLCEELTSAARRRTRARHAKGIAARCEDDGQRDRAPSNRMSPRRVAVPPAGAHEFRAFRLVVQRHVSRRGISALPAIAVVPAATAAVIRRLTSGAGDARRRAERLRPPARRALAQVLGWRARLSSRQVGGALVYHRVHDAGAREPPAGDVVDERTLEAHLRHLRSSYRIVTAAELPCAVASRRRGQRIPVAVTFDDDLRSHVTVVAPLLRRLGCTATFFLTGAALDGPHAFWWERVAIAELRGVDVAARLRSAGLVVDTDASSLREAIEALRPPERDRVASALLEMIGADPPDEGLRDAEVRGLAQGGFDVGFHTLRHDRLPDLPDDDLERALRAGREDLERAAGRRLTVIAYPHGAADGRVAGAAAAAGYVTGFTGRASAAHAGGDRLLIGRLEILGSADRLALGLARLTLEPDQPLRRGARRR